MPIKFSCPHCKQVIAVRDQLAGRKGACPGCKQMLTVPQPDGAASAAKPGPAEQPKPSRPPAPASAPPNTAPTPPSKAVRPPTPAAKVEPSPSPPPAPADVEAEAAALFADEPKPAEQIEVKKIELNCPFCDEAIQFPANLAGKREPCPECKRIIKVPELVKNEPKDWRKVDPRGPSGARLPDQPVPEGAWSSTASSSVGKKSLEEAGVLPTAVEPRTLRQKIQWPLLGVTAAVLLGVGGWMGYQWWGRRAC